MMKELPFELGQLERVKMLEVSHNPLLIPPQPIVAKGADAILDWLRKNEQRGKKVKASGLGTRDLKGQEIW